MKQRKVIRHGSHPFQRYGRLISRCLSLLWKSGCSHHRVLEFISMQELRSVIHDWSSLYPGECVTLAELDLVEMFPNVDPLSIAPALIFFFHYHCQSHGLREDQVKFFVHKGGVRGLDCMANNHSRPGFYKFSFPDVLHFVFWDLMFNDTFVMCSSIFAQALGTAIGGSASAQYASMVVARKEIEVGHDSLPPIIRYRDNFLVLVLRKFLSHTPVHEYIHSVMNRLTATIGMNLTLEAVTPRLPFLEAMVLITSGSCVELTLKPPVFHCCPGASHPPSHKRLLDAFSPNSRDMLTSFVPNQISKCAHYAFGREVIDLNILCLLSLLNRKQYPREWWKPQLLAKCHTIGLDDLALSALNRLSSVYRSG